MSFDLRQKKENFLLVCLNPFGTGQCLSTLHAEIYKDVQESLNPFGTGQCLSTEWLEFIQDQITVSIPLEQGNVFRQRINYAIDYELGVSIPLEQGNVFRLQWGVRSLCGNASQSHFPTFSDV